MILQQWVSPAQLLLLLLLLLLSSSSLLLNFSGYLVFFLTNVLQTLCRFQGFCYRRASGSVRFARRSAVGWILLLEKVGSARHSRNAIKHFKGNLK